MISSRTPEGWPNTCPVCGHALRIEPSSFPIRDAPCPDCGTLLEFDEPAAITIQFQTDNFSSTLDRLDDLIGRQAEPCVRLDFEGVTFLDSRMLGRLLTLHRVLQIKKGRLVLCNLSPSICEVFKIAKLDRLFENEDDEDDEDT